MGPGPGRPKGVPNKITVEFRETVRRLLEDNAGNVATWLQQVASGEHNGRPDPAKALDLLASLAEFAAPKLSRTEHVGDGGGPVKATLDVSGMPTDVLAQIMRARDAAERG